MATRICRWCARCIAWALSLLIVIGGWGVEPQSALARIVQEQLSDGVTLDKSLRTVKDANGYSWQAIAFKNSRDGHSDGVYLRLVGFPGAVAIDHTHPMIVTTPSGQAISLEDVSALIFSNDASRQPNVAQYELDAMLNQLQSPTNIRLTIPVLMPGAAASEDSGTSLADRQHLEMSIPQAAVDEWLAIAHL